MKEKYNIFGNNMIKKNILKFIYFHFILQNTQHFSFFIQDIHTYAQENRKKALFSFECIILKNKEKF